MATQKKRKSDNFLYRMINMEDLCENLLGTYNTNYIDKGSPLAQAVFIDESARHRSGGKGRTSLMDLVSNHRAAEMPTPGYIGGPFTLTLHQSKKDRKIIYIFGECHDTRMDCELYIKNFRKTKKELKDGCPEGKVRNPTTGICVKETGAVGKSVIAANNKLPLANSREHVDSAMSFEDFMFKMLTTTDVFIDAFFELPAYRGKGYNEPEFKYLAPSRIQNLFEKVGECIQEKTRSSSFCKLARIHYTDVRKLEHSGVGDVSVFRRSYTLKLRGVLALDQQFHFSKQLMEPGTPTERTVVKLGGKGPDEEYMAFWWKQIFENPFVKKELSRSYRSEDIKDFGFHTLVREALPERATFLFYYKILKANENGKTREQRKDYVDALKGIYNATVAINSSLVDIYTLSRIFKVFSGPHPDSPPEPSNIILYYGNQHAVRVRKFLSDHGYTTLKATEAPGKIKNCVSTEGFPTPFFSVPV